MPIPDQIYASGDPWKPNAAQFNFWTEGARAAQRGSGASAGALGQGPPLYTVVNVFNDTDDPLPHLACVAYRDPLITPSQDERAFRFAPVVKCQLPTEEAIYRHGILLQPLNPDSIGLALISGVTAVRITGDGIGDGAKFAKPAAGETSLETSASEGWPLLWAESGAPAERWGLVEVAGTGGSCGQSYDFRFMGLPVGGWGKFNLQYNAVTETIQIDWDTTDAELKTLIDNHPEYLAASPPKTCTIIASTGSPLNGNVIIQLPSGSTVTFHSQALTRSAHGFDPIFEVWVVGPCG
jgi:hypothetical protein